MKAGDAIEVLWIDSTAHHGWQEQIPASEDLATRTVGIFVKGDEQTLVMALGQQSTGETVWLCPLTIPRFAITEVRKLRK